MDPVTAKFATSLLAVLIGGGLAYAGWDLFRRGVVSHSKGGLSAPGGVSVNWQTAGPGIAFVLLGAAIIVFALIRPMSREIETVDPSGLRQSERATAAATAPMESEPTPSADAPAAAAGTSAFPAVAD